MTDTLARLQNVLQDRFLLERELGPGGMEPRLRPCLGIGILLALAAAVPALAQCPDGTPPPCAGAARRPLPPIDQRTWIVLPFENQSRSPEIDWLSDASANLLYLDLSRWQDIRVVDDERVADLMRDVPAVGGVRQLTQSTGTALARRVGAGKLVMGDLLKVGTRTVLVAKVYDVRSGRRLRSVREESADPDSLMPTFSRLARGILDAPPPAGVSGAVLGTTRLDAYREYVAGVAALNAFNTTEAQAHFRRALELDSTFALAHYKLAIVLGWSEAEDPGIRAHAEAAARLATALPARERGLIAGVVAMAQEDYPRACEVYASLGRADSADIEALYGLGECNFHDAAVLPVAGDTTRLEFRSSWNTTLRVNRRILELDPTYHLAFQHIQDALTAGSRPGCRPRAGETRCTAATLLAPLIRSGDSLVGIPVSLADGGHAFPARALEALRSGSVRRNLVAARDIALEWVGAGPEEPRARLAAAGVLLRLGDVAAADTQLRMVRGTSGRIDRLQLAMARYEAALKLDRHAEARHVIDSLALAHDTGAVARIPVNLGLAFGRLARLDSMLQTVPAPPAIVRYARIGARVITGLPADSLLDAERGVGTALGPSQAGRVALYIASTLAFGPLDRSAADWTASDTTAPEGSLRLVSFLATGDTARFRRALAAFDSLIGSLTDNPDAGFRLLSARVHLLLGDSAEARRQLRVFADSTWRITPAQTPVGPVQPAMAMMLWPRTFLLQGDLEAAGGDRARATEAYRRVIGFWEEGDREVQPFVQRAREALARLSAP